MTSAITTRNILEISCGIYVMAEVEYLFGKILVVRESNGFTWNIKTKKNSFEEIVTELVEAFGTIEGIRANLREVLAA